MLMILYQLLTADDGQDLIEYALLTAAVGFVGMAGFSLMSNGIFDAYTSWDAAVNDLWETPDPE